MQDEVIRGKNLRKQQVAMWATVTFGLAWGFFAFAMPIYNRRKVLDPQGYASVFLLLPFRVCGLLPGRSILPARNVVNQLWEYCWVLDWSFWC
ncbi:MAG TPA: hypothetical protein VFW25_06735 [Silvibacterium sp.]|nr:hypothetical protein [Silvibacterium sp.]